MPGSPRRDDGGTIPAGARRPCPACTTEFVPVGRAIYCSTACRKRAFRARRGRQAVPVVPAGTFRRDHTVYECPDCLLTDLSTTPDLGTREAG